MLSVSPEYVCYLIVKAREFDEKVEAEWETSDTGSNPSDDRDVEVLEDYADDPTFQELMSALESLNEDQHIELVALAWLGRGDYATEEWDEALGEARDVRHKHAPIYLAGMPKLGDYLEEGLAQLGYSCEEYAMGRL